MIPRRGCCLWQSRFQLQGLKLLPAKLGCGGEGSAGLGAGGGGSCCCSRAQAGLTHTAAPGNAGHSNPRGSDRRRRHCLESWRLGAALCPFPGDAAPAVLGTAGPGQQAPVPGTAAPGPAGRFREFSLPFQAWQKSSSSDLRLPRGRGKNFGVRPRDWEDYQRLEGLEIYAPLSSLLQNVVWLLEGSREGICYIRDSSSDHRNLEKGYGVKRSKFPAISHHLHGRNLRGCQELRHRFWDPETSHNHMTLNK